MSNNGDASLTATAGQRNVLRYNPSAPRFSCYSQNNNQQAVRLYRKSGQSVSTVTDDPLTASGDYGCYISGAVRT